MDTLFGYPAKLTIQYFGNEIDVTDCIEVTSGAHEVSRIEINPSKLLREIGYTARLLGQTAHETARSQPETPHLQGESG